jgi:hypothetical protein
MSIPCRSGAVLLLAALCAASPRQIQSQSARPVSLQVSAAGLLIDQGVIPGGEAQVRLTANKVSVGVGYQFFTREDATTAIAFLEPRFRLATSRFVAAYAAGRVGIIPSSETLVYGGGGGLLIAVQRTTALDLGVQVYSVDARTSVTQLRLGLSLGL